MWELLTHQVPWDGIAMADTFVAVAMGKRPEIPRNLEAQAPVGWCDMMRQCWDQTPSNRPTCHRIHEQLVSMKEEYGRNEADTVSRTDGINVPVAQVDVTRSSVVKVVSV